MLVASEECERVSSHLHDSLRPFSLVNHYILIYIFYFRAGDLRRGSGRGVQPLYGAGKVVQGLDSTVPNFVYTVKML